MTILHTCIKRFLPGLTAVFICAAAIAQAPRPWGGKGWQTNGLQADSALSFPVRDTALVKAFWVSGFAGAGRRHGLVTIQPTNRLPYYYDSIAGYWKGFFIGAPLHSATQAGLITPEFQEIYGAKHAKGWWNFLGHENIDYTVYIVNDHQGPNASASVSLDNGTGNMAMLMLKSDGSDSANHVSLDAIGGSGAIKLQINGADGLALLPNRKIRIPAYGNTDTNLVLSADSYGNLIWRNKRWDWNGVFTGDWQHIPYIQNAALTLARGDSAYIRNLRLSGGYVQFYKNGTWQNAFSASIVTPGGNAYGQIQFRDSAGTEFRANSSLHVAGTGPSTVLNVGEGSRANLYARNLGSVDAARIGTDAGNNQHGIYFSQFNSGIFGDINIFMRDLEGQIIKLTGTHGGHTVSLGAYNYFKNTTYFGYASAGNIRIDNGKIDIFNQDETAARITIERDAIGSDKPGIILKATSTGTPNTNGAGVAQPADKSIAIYTSDGSGLAERMRINGSGQVGIGTDNPHSSAMVQISGNTGRGLGIPVVSAAPSGAIQGLAWHSNATDQLYIQNAAASRPVAMAGEKVLTYAASVTWDVRQGNNAFIDVTNNCTVTITNANDGDAGVIVVKNSTSSDNPGFAISGTRLYRTDSFLGKIGYYGKYAWNKSNGIIFWEWRGDSFAP